MPKRKLKFVPQTDGAPHRPWSSINVRREDKRRFDLIHASWQMQLGEDLSQWDCFSVLLSDYLRRAHQDLPAGVAEQCAVVE